MVSAWLVLRPAWPVLVFDLFSFTPSPFLPSSLLFLCSFTTAHRFGIFGPITRRRHGESGTPSTLRPRLPGPWPAVWTHGGVELNCQLKLSYVFSFVESGCVDDDRPGYPRVKGMRNNVDGSGKWVLS